MAVAPVVFRRTSGLWIPCVAVVIVAIAGLAGVDRGAVALLAVAATVAVLLWTLMAVTGRVVIRDGLLSVHGGPPFNGYNRGSRPVHLPSLSRCYSVAISQYGAELRRWPVRTVAILEDAQGGRQQLPMRWWSHSQELRDLIRQSAVESGAICDATVVRWLGGGVASPGLTQGKVIRRSVTSVRVFGRDFTI